MEKNKTGRIVPGKLTITNFIGSSHAHVASLTENKYIFGQVTDGKTTLLLSANTSTPAEGTIRGGKITNPSITLNVFKVKGRSAEPFTEDINIPTPDIPDNEMSLTLYEFSTETLSGSPDGVYINTSAIDFRNGNATLNFGYQMEWLD